jgi:hypothetical protein
MRKKITEDEHQHVFRMYYEDMRLKLATHLRYDERDAKPFFGMGTDLSLYEAATRSTRGFQDGDHMTLSRVRHIPVEVIAVLHEFASEDLEEDPLRDQQPSRRALTKMELFYPGLYRYYMLIQDFRLFSGKIKSVADGKEVGPEHPAFRDTMREPLDKESG